MMRVALFTVAVLVCATLVLGPDASAQSVSGPTIHNVTLHEGSGVLTITGVGFGRDPVVTVDGQPVGILQGASETRLDVLTPASLLTTPGSYRLTVQDAVTRAGDAFVVATGSGTSVSTAAPRAASSGTISPLGAIPAIPDAAALVGPGSSRLTPHVFEGISNTAVGQAALASNTGIGNTAMGYSALNANSSGYRNTATGNSALLFNTSGYHNTAVGDSALLINGTGSYNTALGSGALLSNTVGAANTATGYDALSKNETGIDNTANGINALHENKSGSFNTAMGSWALVYNTTGSYNTASGQLALRDTTTGNSNTATGAWALQFNTTGGINTAHGVQALWLNTTGVQNTASGGLALAANTTGGQNTAAGSWALSKNTSGGRNTALGHNAGANATTGSYNLYLGAGVRGTAADTNTIRIGFPYNSGTGQNKTFVAGIRGITTVNPDAITVMIDSAGQLGTVSSSRRFKEDIQDMADASAGIMRLRPVTFRYTQTFAGGAKPRQYGLIAEEVAEVYPDLVVHAADGQVETVQYDKVNAMLLNEVQKQHRELDAQAEQIRTLTEQLTALATRLQGIEAQRFSTRGR